MVVTMRPRRARTGCRRGVFGELVLGQRDVALGGRIGDIPSVEERMNSDLRDLVLGGLPEDLEQVADVGVNVAVRQETDQMERPATTGTAVHDLLPCVGLPDRTGRDGVVDPLARSKMRPAPRMLLTDLGVAHVRVEGSPTAVPWALRGAA